MSRKWPHFDAEPLARALAEDGIAYSGMPELGGRRKPRPDSPHVAWREESFRGYADFMDTPDFEAGLARVFELARSGASRPALMCAEAVPWRCHRSLIADALVARGVEVIGRAVGDLRAAACVADVRAGRGDEGDLRRGES